MTIRVILLDDHHLLQQGVIRVLTPHPDIELVGASAHSAEFFALLDQTQPDVAILDLKIAGERFDALTAVRGLARSHPTLKIIILTGQATPHQTQRLKKAGVRGFLMKNDDLSLNLAQAIRDVAGGEPGYSPSALKNLLVEDLEAYFNQGEIQMIRLLAQGFTNASIAQAMSLSESRVKNVLNRLFARLNIPDEPGINPRTMVVSVALRLGLIELDDLPLNSDIGWTART